MMYIVAKDDVLIQQKGQGAKLKPINLAKPDAA
jgi:hypothetical protein